MLYLDKKKSYEETFLYYLRYKSYIVLSFCIFFSIKQVLILKIMTKVEEKNEDLRKIYDEMSDEVKYIIKIYNNDYQDKYVKNTINSMTI